MLSDLQKQTIRAIVNIFETGRVAGDYGQVTLLPGDPGHLTYGRSQTTLASGNLGRLIKSYCSLPHAGFSGALRPFLPRLERNDLSLDNDMNFRSLLKKAGADIVMQQVQDSFFDKLYWMPATKAASDLPALEALSHAVVYDSFIHGSWAAISNHTMSRYGVTSKIGERKWIGAYVQERRKWLASHANPLLRKTVYRMDAFDVLLKSGNWKLSLPLSIRGVRIETASFNAAAPAPRPTARTLKLTTPPMTGEDVRNLQKALSLEGYAINCDGVFGAGLDKALKAFQEEYGIVADGVVGPATLVMLKLEERPV